MYIVERKAYKGSVLPSVMLIESNQASLQAIDHTARAIYFLQVMSPGVHWKHHFYLFTYFIINNSIQDVDFKFQQIF